MAFARHRDESSSNSKNKISGILETFLLKKPLKNQPNPNKSINKSLEKSISNPRKPAYSYSEIKPKNSRHSLYTNGLNETEKTCNTENCDDFSYLDKIKKKIEKTLASTNDKKNESVEKMWENDENYLENEESGVLKENLRKLQLKDAINRQEITKLKSTNEKLVNKVLQLEEIINSFKQNKERDVKTLTLMEKELSNEKRKAITLETKLKKINPVKTAQLFQEILVKNESLTKEKEELEELLKQMLLDKEISRIKTPFKSKITPISYQTQKSEHFFNSNEAQKPYEIRENPQIKLRNSFSNHCSPNYEYLNDGDEKLHSKSMHINSTKSAPNIFEKLGGQANISKVMDLFMEKVLKDSRISSFFKGSYDIQVMKANQNAFFCRLFGGGPDDNNGKEDLYEMDQMKITDFHFDIIKNHLIKCLNDINMGEDVKEEVAELMEKSRKTVVFQGDHEENPIDNQNRDNYDNNNNTEEDCENNSREKAKQSNITMSPNNNDNNKSLIENSNNNANKFPGVSEEESLRFLQEIHTHSAQRFEQSLYLRLGGFDKITNLVEKFYEKQLQDNRINSLYEGNDLNRLLHNLKYFLTKIFGGPDIFLGKSLRDCDQNINTSKFYSGISLENFREAAEELNMSEEYITQMMEILNKKIEIIFVAPAAQSLYEILGGYKSIAGLVEMLYKRLNEGFFVDMKEEYEKMKQNQKFYITKILGGPDTFLGENGRNFWKDPWLMKSGEEKWLEILEGCLEEMNVRKDVAEKVKEVFANEIK